MLEIDPARTAFLARLHGSARSIVDAADRSDTVRTLLERLTEAVPGAGSDDMRVAISAALSARAARENGGRAAGHG